MKKQDQHTFDREGRCTNCGCPKVEADKRMCLRACAEDMQLAAQQGAEAYFNKSGDIVYARPDR